MVAATRSTPDSDGSDRTQLNIPAVIGPMKQGLPLLRPAKRIAWLAILSDLRGMTAERAPTCDLAAVFARHPPA